jgi:hypothetical protein
MSTDDAKQLGKLTQHEEPQDEVDAHMKRLGANDEGAADDENEVEAHRHTHKIAGKFDDKAV